MPQSFTSLHFHIVFSTKERRPMIVGDLRERLYEYVGGVLNENKSKLIAVGGMPDHIHLLASINKELLISAALRLIKSNSSKWAHETFPKHRNFAWQSGYSAFAVSYSMLDRVKKYIADQEAHHRKATFKDELKALLKKHDLEFNEKYLWD